MQRNRVLYVVDTMPADDLAIEEAKALTAMVLT